MEKTAFSIRVYSFYLFGMGLALMCAPNLLLSILSLPETTEIWIRILGLFTFTTGIYYFIASMQNQDLFYKATILGRFFFFAMMIVLTLVFKLSPLFIVIGSVDFFGASWTLYTLKKK